MRELSGEVRELQQAGVDGVECRQWAAGLAAHGAPEALATMLLGMFRAARRGEFSATSPTLGNLLGRAATPLSSFLEGVAAAH